MAGQYNGKLSPQGYDLNDGAGNHAFFDMDEQTSTTTDVKASATAESVPAGTPAGVSVTNEGDGVHADFHFNFQIPEGKQGEQGAQGVQGAKGETGATGAQGAAGADGVTPSISATATVDGTTGTPGVTVTKSGTDEAPTFAFDFTGLKGETGATGEQGAKGETGATGAQGAAGATPDITINATADDTTGTPSVSVTKSGTELAPVFDFAFSGLKGKDGGGGEYESTIKTTTDFNSIPAGAYISDISISQNTAPVSSYLQTSFDSSSNKTTFSTGTDFPYFSNYTINPARTKEELFMPHFANNFIILADVSVRVSNKRQYIRSVVNIQIYNDNTAAIYPMTYNAITGNSWAHREYFNTANNSPGTGTITYYYREKKQ